jgi:hypothetical protein
MPGLPVLIGVVAGGLITFELTSRRWSRRRRIRAQEAARRLVPRLQAVDAAVADALATRRWGPVDVVDLTDHSLPGLAMKVAGDLPREAADPFADGVVAVHDLDRVRGLLSLEEPRQRDEIEGYRRRIDTASAIADALVEDR